MNWSTPSSLLKQVQKLWDKGTLLRELAGEDTIFPLKLRLAKPRSGELSDHFAEVQDWITELRGGARLYRIVWRRVQHRVLGENELPNEIWVDTLDDALSMIGKRREEKCFREVLELTEQRNPVLKAWLVKRPLKSLELAGEWECLLCIVAWMKEHPRPEIYLRQVDLPGVHSKFIESRRAVLAELFDLMLEPNVINESACGVKGFCNRYGFKDKPQLVRFRMLDGSQSLFPTGTDQDISVPQDTFSKLDIPVERIFITENEINFLVFPPVSRSMVIFGAGYGFDVLAAADWLHSRQLFYWGDLDTHGFAILDQFRAHFPQAQSFLMDQETFLAHKDYWGHEEHPESRALPRLTPEEGILYEELRNNAHGTKLRLEQEHIGYRWLQDFLDRHFAE